MKIQRLLGCALIAIQASVLWYFTETLVFPISVVLLSLASLITPQRFHVIRPVAFWGLVGMFVIFVIKFYVAPHTFVPALLFIRTSFAYTVGQFLLTYQTIQFYIRRPDDRLPVSFPAWGIFALACFGDIQARHDQMQVFQYAVVAFVVVLSLYISASGFYWQALEKRRGWLHTIVSALVIAIVAGTGWGASFGLRRHERDFDEFVARYLAPDNLPMKPGFSGKARLGSVAQVKITDDQQIALRVYADQEPGYLRGEAFETYQKSNWQPNPQRHSLKALTKLPAGIEAAPGGYQAFLTADATSDNWTQLRIWPAASQAPAFFAPLETTLFQAPLRSASVDDNGILHLDDLAQGIPFHVAIPDDRFLPKLSDKDRERLTQIPEELDPLVAALAAKLFENCKSTAEKIAAVENYFLANYQYQIGIDIPAKTDPLNYFLLQRPPAHCEYFASGAAVLLRLGNVPCRYATGFFAAEKNSFGGYWLARNRDAHAWVEAFDEQHGWRIVEATPSDGVPEPQKTAHAKQFWEYLREAFLSLRIQLQQGYFRIALRSLIQSRGLMLTLLCLMFYVLYRLIRARKPKIRHRPEFVEPHFQELQRMLKKMDARLRKHHLQRLPEETLHQFAKRVAQSDLQNNRQTTVAAWYRDYATVRYGGRYTKSEHQRLKTTMPNI